MSEPTITFWSLFRSLLRPEKATPEQVVTARTACTWLSNELHAITRWLNVDEAKVLGVVYNHWRDHKEAPSYAILRHVVDSSKDAGLQYSFGEYEKIGSDLTRYAPEDLQALLNMKAEEFREEAVLRMLREAAAIVTEGLEIPIKGGKKESRKGAGDAVRHVIDRLNTGLLRNPGGVVTHGSLAGDAHRIASHYDQLTDKTSSFGKPIRTGLADLDKHVLPTKGNLVGILGYAKAGKTRLGRTWVYNALCQGYNVMHLSYEQTFMEELPIYACIHSHNEALWDPSEGLDYTAYREGRLTHIQEAYLKEKLIPDLEKNRSLPGQLFLRQPTGSGSWDEAKTQVEVQHHSTALDMLFVDYITAIPIPPINQQTAYNAIIQDAKTWAMTFGDGDSLLIASPFQCNRESWVKAGTNGGRYDQDAAYMYSQIEKAVDKLYYVYSDDKLDNESCVILGTCIHRQGKNVAPHRVSVRHGCGQFRDFRAKVSEEALEEVLAVL